MVFFLYGPNTFLCKRKLGEIIEKYRSKYKSGFNFSKTEATEEGFLDLKDKTETISMFSEKKLIIIENLLSAKKSIQETFQKYFEKSNLFEKEDVSLVVVEKGSPDKRSKLFKTLFKKSLKKQEFLDLAPFKTREFIEKETKTLGISIVPSAIDEMLFLLGNDLWQIQNEIQKLSSFKEEEEITKEDVRNLCVGNVDLNIFKTIEAISKKDKKLSLKLISEHFEKGENEIKILSMINYQFRVLIKIKSLLDEKKSFFEIQKTSKLHPFVVKKTIPLAGRFSMEDLKKIYNKILETDFAIKTGKIEPKLGIEMFVMEI